MVALTTRLRINYLCPVIIRLLHLAGKCVIHQNVRPVELRAERPDRSSSQQVPVVLGLEELSQRLPVPFDAHLSRHENPSLRRIIHALVVHSDAGGVTWGWAPFASGQCRTREIIFFLLLPARSPLLVNPPLSPP